MPNESEIFLSQLISMNRENQHAAIKELSRTFLRSSVEDLKGILRFLITIDDFKLELKLFALLAASITNNAAHYEFIVLYDPLYDKLNSILSRGLSLKSTIILNFITALVYTDAESASSRTQLTIHAKNIVRVSGCLRHLATFFLDTMMFPDTWKSLCQCVAECCRDMKLNCDHCAHLIPVCIQKCFQGLLDAITVLNSLLDQNLKNIKKFIRSNGIKIFTRDSLQSTACLQLLCTVVQHSPEAVSYFRNNEFSKEISQILEWSGPYSPNGRWCAIILYYINDQNPINDIIPSSKPDHGLNEDSPVADRTSLFENTLSKQNSTNNKLKHKYENGTGTNNTMKLFQNIMHEIQSCKTKDGGIKNNFSNNRSAPNEIHRFLTPVLNSNDVKEDHPAAVKKDNFFEHSASHEKGKNYKLHKDGKGGNDTTMLFQNIIKEIINCNDKDMRGDIYRFLTKNRTNPNRIRNLEMSPTINCNNKRASKIPLMSEEPYNFSKFNFKNTFVDSPDKDHDMTFSFLRNGDNSLDSRSNNKAASKVNENYQNNVSLTRDTRVAEKSCQVETSFTNTNNTYCNNCVDKKENFDPAVTSTPKNRNKPQSFYKKAPFMPHLKVQTIKRTTTTETIKRSSTCLQANHKKFVEKRKLRKALKKSPVVKSLTKRSMSSRFLDAVNESCTTIIKSVKDLFMNKQKTLQNDNNVQPISTGHSFMDYMRQRDAKNMTATYNQNNKMDFSLDDKDHGCITCDDTVMLKMKMQTDKNLKRTIRKLKAGINMYGSDFKKISQMLWPQERYMTPAVLYNLYRKLILK